MKSPSRFPHALIADDVELGKGVKLYGYVNLYGCQIGDETRIGNFVEIQKGVAVGKRCKISSHSFLCEGVTLEDGVFVGHHVCFTNDRFPKALNARGESAGEADWECIPTRVEAGASIGSGVVVLPGVVIGAGALVGAGSVVTRDIPARSVVVGNPARVIRTLEP